MAYIYLCQMCIYFKEHRYGYCGQDHYLVSVMHVCVLELKNAIAVTHQSLSPEEPGKYSYYTVYAM